MPPSFPFQIKEMLVEAGFPDNGATSIPVLGAATLAGEAARVQGCCCCACRRLLLHLPRLQPSNALCLLRPVPSLLRWPALRSPLPSICHSSLPPLPLCRPHRKRLLAAL